MSIGSAVVLVFLMLLAGSVLTVAVRAWRDPGMSGERVPFARSALLGPQGRAALGRAMLAWACSLMFICVVGVLTAVRGSRSPQSAQGRELQPYAFAAMGGIVVCALMVLTIAWFNRPQFMVPPHRRAEQGLVSAWWAERRGGAGREPAVADPIATGSARPGRVSATDDAAARTGSAPRRTRAFTVDGAPGELIVQRSGAWGRDLLRAYEVWVDQGEVAAVKRGGVVRIPLDPGAHAVQIRIDWCSSPELTVVVEAGTQTRISCGPNKTGTGPLRQVLDDPGNYVWLREDVAA